MFHHWTSTELALHSDCIVMLHSADSRGSRTGMDGQPRIPDNDDALGQKSTRTDAAPATPSPLRKADARQRTLAKSR